MSTYIGGADFNGDGTTSDLLPGTTVNALGRSLNKNDLALLVDRYNERNPLGQPAARFNQVFGSGGPRALQVGSRLRF